MRTIGSFASHGQTLMPPAQSPHRKRILVPLFSQTGQLAEIVERILAPLRADPAFDIHIEYLQPLAPFPYPWSLRRFFDCFPESALLKPAAIKAPNLALDAHFDLVILPYQVWFLAPSQPVVAFLQDKRMQALLAGKPVVSIVACRNMWLMAQEKLKLLLDQSGARLIDHLAFTDRAPTLATLLTTPLWLLSGKRQAIRWLPPAGVSAADIHAAERFGHALRDALHDNREKLATPMLQGLAAVEVNPRLLTSERAGTRSFLIWGKLLHAAGRPGSPQRVPLLIIYALFLVLLILSVVPLSLCIQALLAPLLGRRHARIQHQFEQPSGAGSERLADYLKQCQ